MDNNLVLLKEFNNNSPIMVSIICNTFNHANLIKRALDSFLNQKVNFGVEILVHDDCSTDGTDLIIKEYSSKFPNVIKPIFEEKNLYSQHISISKIQSERAKGKYIALCEGDDFWSDEFKLFKQVNALENNNSCVSCYNVVNVINGKTNEKLGFMPDINIPTGVYTPEKILEFSLSKYCFQTSSYFVKAPIYKEYFSNRPQFSKKFGVGDVPMLLYFLTKGDAYFINENLSTYSMFNSGSWSDKYSTFSNDQVINNKKACYLGYKLFDKETNKKFHRILKNKLHDLKWSYLFLEKKYFSLFLFDPLSILAIIKNKLFGGKKHGK